MPNVPNQLDIISCSSCGEQLQIYVPEWDTYETKNGMEQD